MQVALVLAAVVAAAAAASPFSSSYRSPLKPLKPLQPFRSAVAASAPVARQVYASAQASSAAYARVSNNDQSANIVRYDSEINPDGSYNYAIETDNGIAAQETGTPVNFGGSPPVVPVVAQGSYSYTSPEGQVVAITYTADQDGFKPSGDAIPTSPPIPPQILRALEWIARNPQSQ